MTLQENEVSKVMKAFQLKIAIKNSKPPIWRRVIVPAGITFSQLGILLNEVMGWSGSHLCEFEFYHLELRIIEDAEEYMEVGYGPYDYLEASTTYIREYLEQNEWFTYTYDLGDDWQHRVTVEKVIEDYEHDYAQVIKYKGDCPVEDCGGIEGYYECLAIIDDKNNPEYDERLAWMQSQGYPCTYDMETVNWNLKKIYFYKWGKGEKRTQHAIYEDVFSGKYGLNATKRDKNKNLEIMQSGKHRMEESLEEIADLFRQYHEKQQGIRGCSLKDIFESYTKEDIVEIAKDKKVKGISGCNKGVLIHKLVAHMLNVDVMEYYFLWQTDLEIKAFEQAVKAGNVYGETEGDIAEKLYQASYAAMQMDGAFVVPNDVAEQYAKINTPEFHEKRKRNSYLLCCLRAAGLIYGITPMSVMMDMLKTNSDICFTETQIKEMVENLPTEYAEYVCKGNRIFHRCLYPDDRGLLEAQGNKDYYIPSRDEIMDLGVLGYLPKSKELRKLINFLEQKTGAFAQQAEYVGMQIQHTICGDCSMQDVFDILMEWGIEFSSDRQLNQLMPLIHDVWNHTRMLLNRGFTPDEINKKARLQPMFASADSDNIISFERAKKNKIYPNAPCPCGSGKKYKNCCRGKER